MSKEETIFGDDWPYSKAKSSLLRSAAIVIREQGPRSATLKNISGRAGVTEPAIFRHFDGVDGMFESLHAVAALFYARFTACLEGDEPTGMDRLEAGVSRIFDSLAANADFAYVVAKPDPIFRQYPRLKEKDAGMYASLAEAFTDCFKSAKADGSLLPGADPSALASAALGLFYQVLYAWVDDVEGYSLHRDGMKAFRAYLAIARNPGRAASSGAKAPAKTKGAAKKR
ncbi:MAG TPA: TetR/AcrR family transcriptional regulator [Spirochaetales bacterium]|nr:TetR/AcrR family transcriptional regulator [Spirochaetales bacterium]HPG85158.1 TetR/AcrR family transcriptional regulator [Spirochaetales bacterium]HPM72577.1 TetR/AcrR family transcriptional regulator [Spirochaetales bacterium]HQO66294.1 TetR/AcrR family transcriptional regulator [Spirochaetales bacterium]